MARKKKNTDDVSDAEKIAAFIAAKKMQKIDRNVGGEYITKSFYKRKKPKEVAKA